MNPIPADLHAYPPPSVYRAGLFYHRGNMDNAPIPVYVVEPHPHPDLGHVFKMTPGLIALLGDPRKPAALPHDAHPSRKKPYQRRPGSRRRRFTIRRK